MACLRLTVFYTHSNFWTVGDFLTNLLAIALQWRAGSGRNVNSRIFTERSASFSRTALSFANDSSCAATLDHGGTHHVQTIHASLHFSSQGKLFEWQALPSPFHLHDLEDDDTSSAGSYTRAPYFTCTRRTRTPCNLVTTRHIWMRCRCAAQYTSAMRLTNGDRRSMIQRANFELEVKRTFLLGQPSLRIPPKPFAFLFYLRSDAVPAWNMSNETATCYTRAQLEELLDRVLPRPNFVIRKTDKTFKDR